jgi:cysteine dioxygenase
MDGCMITCEETPIIQSIDFLVKAIERLFLSESDWTVKHAAILKMLNRADLTTSDINKFTFWDSEKPYTRNLVYNGKHFSILILCWTPGRESKIHNHPSDGCFVKTLRGCIKETRYSVCPETNSFTQNSVKFATEGQVSWMSDEIGLHKIGNPNRDSGSVSMHVYAPPYTTCKVWSGPESPLSEFDIGTIGFFSVMGLRTPQLEGKPGVHAKVIDEIKRNGSVHREQLRKIEMPDDRIDTLESIQKHALRCNA